MLLYRDLPRLRMGGRRYLRKVCMGEQRLLCCGGLLETWMFLKLGEVFKNACGVRLSFAQYTEIYRDEARHGKAFAGLLERYFN